MSETTEEVRELDMAVWKKSILSGPLCGIGMLEKQQDQCGWSRGINGKRERRQ